MPGASYKTSIFGYIIIALDVLKLIGDAVKQGGVPTDMNGWIVFVAGLATGIGLILSKDYNISNAPRPVASAKVSDANAAIPNPSEIKPPVEAVKP